MVSIVFLLIALGHSYICLLIITCCTRIFYEIISLKKVKYEDPKIIFTISLSWYFYTVALLYYLTNYFSDLRFFISNKLFNEFDKYKRTIFFLLYMAGFMCFIITLKRKLVKEQMKIFFWIHLDIFYTCTALLSIIVVYNGMIWFLACVFLVSANDTFALLAGKMFGRT